MYQLYATFNVLWKCAILVHSWCYEVKTPLTSCWHYFDCVFVSLKCFHSKVPKVYYLMMECTVANIIVVVDSNIKNLTLLSLICSKFYRSLPPRLPRKFTHYSYFILISQCIIPILFFLPFLFRYWHPKKHRVDTYLVVAILCKWQWCIYIIWSMKYP